MDTEEFIELDNGYRKLRMSKRKEYETKIETYKEQREKVLTLVNVIKETNTFEQLQAIIDKKFEQSSSLFL